MLRTCVGAVWALLRVPACADWLLVACVCVCMVWMQGGAAMPGLRGLDADALLAKYQAAYDHAAAQADDGASGPLQVRAEHAVQHAAGACSTTRMAVRGSRIAACPETWRVHPCSCVSCAQTREELN